MPHRPRNSGSLLFALLLVFLACKGGGGSGGSTGGGAIQPPGTPPPLNVQIQSLTNKLPGIYKVQYLVQSDGQSLVAAKFEYTTDGSQFFAATQVGGEDPATLPASPGGIFHAFVWNAILDLGMSANFPNARLRISAQDADEVASPVLSNPFAAQMSQLQTELTQSVLPNLADIQNVASSYLASTSVTSSSVSGGVLKESFSYSSSHYAGSGSPSNLQLCPTCATLPQWKKDVWDPIAADLYTVDGETPVEFLVLQLASEDLGVWSGAFTALYPEFAASGDAIAGAGNPAQFTAGMVEEFASEVALSLHVGVCVVSGLPQAASDWLNSGRDIESAWLASADEALYANNPRWCLTTGQTEALLRAGTAIQKIRGLAPGSAQFVLGDSWMGGIAALLGAAADSRVRGAMCFSSEIGQWDLLSADALSHFSPGIENFYERAKKQALLLHVAGNLDGFAIEVANDPAFSKAFQPAQLIGLLHGLGKSSFVQGGCSDYHFPLQLPELWYHSELASYYPGLACRLDLSANFGHGMASPQGIRNWRSFAASVFRDRPRPTITMSSNLNTAAGGAILHVQATVANPAPGTNAPLACRLRFAGDEDNDWRYLGRPDAGLEACNSYPSGGVQFCISQMTPFENKTWGSVLMITTDDPLSPTLLYEATLDVSSVPGNFISFFAEFEDEVLGGALPNAGTTRSYTSSEIGFQVK